MKNSIIKIVSVFALSATFTLVSCQKEAKITPSVSGSSSIVPTVINDDQQDDPMKKNCTAYALSQTLTGNSQVYQYNTTSHLLAFLFNVTDPAIGGSPVRRMVGLSYDRLNNVFVGVTNNTCPDPIHRNRVLVINATGQVTAKIPLVDATGMAVSDLTDIEYNAYDGLFYAIRAFSRVVKVNATTGVVTELTSPFAFPNTIRALATGSNKLVVLETVSATNGRMHDINTTTGAINASQGYLPMAATIGGGAGDYGVYYSTCTIPYSFHAANRYGNAAYYANENWAGVMNTAWTVWMPRIPVFDFAAKQ